MVKRRVVEEFFKQHGFENLGGTNHDRLQHPDGRWTILARHKEIPDLMFEKMKKQAGLR